MASYAERMGTEAGAIPRPSIPSAGSKPAATAASKSTKPASTSDSVPPTATKSSHASSSEYDIFSDAPITPKTRVQGVATVKHVASGSTLIVVGAGKKEKRLVISGITVPKLGFGKAGVDEPFAYQAKEFLRSKVQGQKVVFTLLNGSADKEGGAEYADVFLGDANVAHLMVAAGWAKATLPKPRADKSEKDKKDKDEGEAKAAEPEAAAKPAAKKADGKKDKDAKAAAAPATGAAAIDLSSLPAERAELVKLQIAAEKAKKGMFAPGAVAVRTINWSPDNLTWMKKFKGVAIPAVVDRVLDGTTLRLEVADPANPSSLQHVMLTVSLAGALSPRMPLPGADKAAPAGAAEAVAFVEARLLHADVSLVLQGMDKAGPGAHAQPTLYGTIVHPKGNIAVRLLEAGLAKFVPWTAALAGEKEQAELKAAAGAAAGAGAAKKASYEATVVQIMSGDTIVVKDAAGKEQKLSLASVAAPRAIRGKPAEPFAFEAKEFLRKSLMLKQVTVVPEYVREGKPAAAAAAVAATPEDGAAAAAAAPAGESRAYVSVFKGKYNVAVELVSQGLADVVGYAKDADRPASYAELCQAEATAIAQEKGKHNKKASPAAVQDYTRLSTGSKKDASKKSDEGKKLDAEAKAANKANADRLQIVLNKLTEKPTVHCVLDAVFSTTLLKAYVPALHAYIPLSFSGIVGPRKPAGEGAKNVVGDAAMAYLKQFVQQDIFVEVAALGKFDAFLANIYVGANKENNLAVSLVKQGFASLSPLAAERNANKKALFAAESDAKRKRLGVWADFDEEKEKQEKEKARAESAEALGTGLYLKDGVQYVNAVVTDVADPVHFYVNNVDDPNVKIVADKMAAFDAAAAPEGFAPAKGDLLAGLFADDSKWYRVRLDAIRGDSYVVQFVDFGNFASLELAQLRPLPKDLAAIKQLARPCKLSALKPPRSNTEYFDAAANALAEMTAGLTFQARVDAVEPAPAGQLLCLTLEIESAKTSVNVEMLRRGWVRVNMRPLRRLEELVPELEQYEEEAKRAHLGLWEYGIQDDEFDD